VTLKVENKISRTINIGYCQGIFFIFSDFCDGSQKNKVQMTRRIILSNDLLPLLGENGEAEGRAKSLNPLFGHLDSARKLGKKQNE
jgi:hypothetical protein